MVLFFKAGGEGGAAGATQGVVKGTEEGVIVKSVGELRAAGESDAHHIIQDAAVKDVPGYSSTGAPGVKLAGPSTESGTQHFAATAVQRQAGGGTYAAERRIAYKALRKAGFSKKQARGALKAADQHFSQLGVKPDTTTRIPGNRPNAQ
jgi:hypothetical protein